MRRIISFLIFSLLFSCGQNDTQKKESESSKVEPARDSSIKSSEVEDLGSFTVKVDKSYFFNSPDTKTIRKGYTVKGDIVEVQKSQDNFSYVVYTTASGNKITGWLLRSDLEKNVIAIQPITQSQSEGSITKEKAIRTIKLFLANNVLRGNESEPWPFTKWSSEQKGSVSQESIHLVENLVQFSENESSLIVEFKCRDAGEEQNLRLKFIFKKDLGNNSWLLNSVKTIQQNTSTKLGMWRDKHQDINLSVI